MEISVDNLKRLVNTAQMLRLQYSQDNKYRLEDWITVLEDIVEDIKLNSVK